MHYKKVHIGKTSEILRFIIILKQSVPVIENLINNADSLPSFKMAMQLIGNANQMVAQKMKDIEVASNFHHSILKLKSKLIVKLEALCLDQVK